MTDIVLDDNGGHWITMDAGIVRTTATDVMIDNPDRRGAATSPRHRRALVHDMADGLTVNFGNDYTGGLTLNGVVRVTPKAQQADGPILPHLLPQIPQLVIEGGVQFVWNDGWNSLELKHRTREVNLQLLIEELQTKVANFTPKAQQADGPIDPHSLPQIPQLVIEGGVQFVWNDGWDSLELKHRTREVNLQLLIEELQTEVANLRSRLETLGG